VSGMIDGVSKFYIVYHDTGSMHIEGYRSTEDMAMGALCCRSRDGDWFSRMDAFKKRLDELIERERSPDTPDEECCEADGEDKHG
jgi:hypothetical protein